MVKEIKIRYALLFSIPDLFCAISKSFARNVKYDVFFFKRIFSNARMFQDRAFWSYFYDKRSQRNENLQT